jgi:hypothetical protein
MKYTIALLFLGVLSTQAINQKTNLKLADEEDGDTGIIDALTPQKGACAERLWINNDELEWQMDQFSRKFDIQNYKNAMEIAKELGTKAPQVKSWELMNAAFSFSRVRRYEDVQQNMDMLEHFEDNLNTNISNSVNMANFLRTANTVRKNFNNKYSDGEFDDPGSHDPREEAEAKKTWSQL